MEDKRICKLEEMVKFENGTKFRRLDNKEVVEVYDGFVRDKFGARIMLGLEYICAEYELLPTEITFNEAWDYFCKERVIISLVTKTRYRKINGVPHMLTKYSTKWVKVHHMAINEIENKWIVKY